MMDTEISDLHPDDPLPIVLAPVVDSDTPPASPSQIVDLVEPVTPGINVPYLPSLNSRELNLIDHAIHGAVDLCELASVPLVISMILFGLLILVWEEWREDALNWMYEYLLPYVGLGMATVAHVMPITAAGFAFLYFTADEGHTAGRTIVMVTGLAAVGLVIWADWALLKYSNEGWYFPDLFAPGNTTIPDNTTIQEYCPNCHSGDSEFWIWLSTWHAGSTPQAPVQCQTRVRPQQASLFNSSVYNRQFARTYQDLKHNYGEWGSFGRHGTIRVFKAFNTSAFEAIQNDLSICGTGILGNADVYGLGIRIGIYLQWLSCLLANNFLSDKRQENQKAYLVFHLGLCIATLITTINGSCVFSIEVEILYWLYWGGYIIVFGSAPCAIRLGRASQWVKLDWTTVIVFFTHWIMAYHAIWFMWRGYDQSLARLPCGTYHFSTLR